MPARSAVPSTTDPVTPIWHPSPNFGERRDGLKPSLVVIHYTAMHSAQAALDRLCDPEAEVSAHYLIGSDGNVWQMVREKDRAWHAGAGEWRGRTDINSRSIGIELDNSGQVPFSEPQMAALENLLSDIQGRLGIHPWNVIGHSDMAPQRKLDPGPKFDWDRLTRRRLGVGPVVLKGISLDEMPPDEKHFAFIAMRAGYPEARTEDLLKAFRNRFSPTRRGPLSKKDMGDIERLAGLMERLDGIRAEV
ncbi:N-acetylmuramoyl-L-alanine amidase [uncultured Ruegeria sp.]|uniref:N-acetylmuramoyl-L-alanine amidase n=1 Tax=uncultured Ruegeria sp. TaxID=259304 RepID=UPI00261AECFF|nr:N-acetylmuramoyl-L-alanine amidase [uncultured Ruegeria sp.]